MNVLGAVTRALFVAADVATPQGCNELIDAAVAAVAVFGRLDI
jgi:hypothetical protein